MPLQSNDYCMLVGKIYSLTGDTGDDVDFNPDESGLNGQILLEPLVPQDALYHYVDSGSSRSNDYSYVVDDVVVNVKNGVLHHLEPNYVNLVSKLPGVDRPLQWRVRFGELTDSKGNVFRPPSFVFDTVPGGTVSLAKAAPVTGFEATGTSKGDDGDTIEGIAVSGSDLVMTLRSGDGETRSERIAMGEVAKTVANDAVSRAELAALQAQQTSQSISAFTGAGMKPGMVLRWDGQKLSGSWADMHPANYSDIY